MRGNGTSTSLTWQFAARKAFGFAAVLLLAGLFPAVPLRAAGASLYFSPSSGSYQVGKSFTVNVMLSSPDQAMNAASGTVSFPADKLEIVSVSKSGSVFNLWAQDPVYSNSSGTVSFEGIVYNPGFQGSGKKVLGITFRVTGQGEARVSFVSASVLANDGNGTPIPTSGGIASFTLGGVSSEPSREPGIPAPRVSSPTHPSPDTWYGSSAPEFRWAIPSGVTAVSFTADKNAGTVPQTSINGLKTSYTYPRVADGVYYFHIRFRTQQGWGPVTHYRFQIDTEIPPVPNLIRLPAGPEGQVRFKATGADSGSGVGHFELALDGGQSVACESVAEYCEFGDVVAGRHELKVVAVDKAGNISEPLALPFTVDASAPSDSRQAGVMPVPEVVRQPGAVWSWVRAYGLPLLALLVLLAELAWFLRRRTGMFRGAGPVRVSPEFYFGELRKISRDIRKEVLVLEKASLRRQLTKEELNVLTQLRKQVLAIDHSLIAEAQESLKQQ